MSVYVRPPVTKASPVGPGSGVLQTEFPLSYYGIGNKSPQKKMRKAWSLSFEVPWIAAAEDAIIERFSGVEWHLEDDQDTTIDDTYPNRDAQTARALIEKPAANLPDREPYYRSDLWALTGRAMGVCGSSFIYLDQPEALGGTPAAMLPVAPWRFTPNEDANGNLLSWWIDKSQEKPGIAVSIEQVLHFRLRRAFEGHFGIGLIESAMLKAQIATGLDQHVGMVLSAGGRLSGIVSPKQGVMEAETMLQMERDWRTVVEQTDAAKRLQLVRAPITFDRTTLTPRELQVRDLLNGARDDLLQLWGVPISIIGGTTPAGLNSGDTRKYDEAAIWQGPVHHRLNVFREVVQYQLLDRWRLLGATVELEIDEPEFDDDSPRYDLLSKSLNTPLTNAQRLALIGIEPTGVPEVDNAILLPATIVPYTILPSKPEEGPTAVVLGREAQQSNAEATAAAGETSDGKATLKPHQAALHTSLVNLRQNLARSTTPRIRAAVGKVLAEQRAEIATRLRRNATHVSAKPADAQKWWDAAKWDARLRDAIRPHAITMAQSVADHVATLLPPAKAGPVGAVDRVLDRGAARVKGINDTTRKHVQDAIIAGLDQGLSVHDVADLIEQDAIFDELRAETIARTELMDAYNGAALGSYGDAGVTQVQAIDGDGDEECAARDGQVFDIDEADSIEDHPNGTLDWVPVIGEAKARPSLVDIASADQMSVLRTLLAQQREPVNVTVAAPEWPKQNADVFLERGEDGRISAIRAQPPSREPISDLIATLREMPAPVVNVSVPRQAPPVVNVDAPVVTVEPPVVNLPTAPKRVVKTVTRDAEGNVTGSVEESA